jgi:hypothetical protein
MNSASGYQKNLSGRAEEIAMGVLRIWMGRKVKEFFRRELGFRGRGRMQLPHGNDEDKGVVIAFSWLNKDPRGAALRGGGGEG